MQCKPRVINLKYFTTLLLITSQKELVINCWLITIVHYLRKIFFFVHFRQQITLLKYYDVFLNLSLGRSGLSHPNIFQIDKKVTMQLLVSSIAIIGKPINRLSSQFDYNFSISIAVQKNINRTVKPNLLARITKKKKKHISA